MSKKILSICIPSYNMEKYLPRCIDSLVGATDVLDVLEIIIVNDGSKDGTLEIADSYKKQHPQSIVVIDKPNGHYGSCINASLKVASGKYFRVLDADDWFDTTALGTFVKLLQGVDYDVIGTNFTYQYVEDKNAVPKEIPNVKYNKVYDLQQDLLPDKYIFMHSLTYKLSHLKNIGYHQTEGICYTDNEYAYFPCITARTAYFLDLYLYQYFIGRDDQSISIKSLIKNTNHFLTVSQSIYNDDSYRPFNCNRDMLRQEVLVQQLRHLTKALLLAPYKIDTTAFRDLLYKMNFSDNKTFMYILNNIHVMHINYVRRWYEGGVFNKLLCYIARCYYRLKNRQ